MSIGPLGGIIGSAAGAPLAQTQGSELDRAAEETSAQERRVHNETKAEAASGIAAPDGEEKETEERDADGRRLWEEPPKPTEEAMENNDVLHAGDSRQSKDATGTCGNQLDLSG